MRENITGTKRQALRLSLASLFVAVLLIAVGATQSSAGAASGGGNGLRISPVRSDVTVNPGTSQTVIINVTNVTAATSTFQTIVNDFTASPDESGNPAILLSSSQYASSHSLKRFIGPVGTFTLASGQSKAVPIVITVPKNAVGGGYFGAIRFAPASTKYSQNQNLSLAGSVGSLILAKVPGDITEKLAIASFDVRRNDRPSSFFTSNKDLTATVRFQNQGNVQEAPFGKVLLRNSSGAQLASFELNNETPAANVLPDSIRKFPLKLTKVGSFGQYKLVGNFGYGSNGQLMTASTTFYVIPLSIIYIFAGIVLLLLFLVFVLPKLVQAYNRRILRMAGRTLSKSKRRH